MSINECSNSLIIMVMPGLNAILEGFISGSRKFYVFSSGFLISRSYFIFINFSKLSAFLVA